VRFRAEGEGVYAAVLEDHVLAVAKMNR